jgi:hypothetical protein
MKTFLEMMREWDSVDPSSERKSKDGLNMTAGIPARGVSINDLTRGFHLNTIVGRMMTPWVNTLEMDSWQRSLPEKFRDGGKINRNFLAAYDLFKNELAKAVNGLPFKKGRDVTKGKVVDVLGGARGLLKGYGGEAGDYMLHLDKALKIQASVFPIMPSLVHHFINFLEIVRDEFMTFGEVLPTLGEPDLERDKKEERRINAKISELEAFRIGMERAIDKEVE